MTSGAMWSPATKIHLAIASLPLPATILRDEASWRDVQGKTITICTYPPIMLHLHIIYGNGWSSNMNFKDSNTRRAGKGWCSILRFLNAIFYLKRWYLNNAFEDEYLPLQGKYFSFKAPLVVNLQRSARWTLRVGLSSFIFRYFFFSLPSSFSFEV